MRIGGYEVTGRCIRGGFGDVLECCEVGGARRVAVKLLHPGISVSTREVERFRREADALRRLRHPHIVDLLEVGLDNGRPYFAMEWLDGVTLEEELRRRGPLAPADAWPLVEPLCQALSAAHSQGIIHRDLKPANAMVVPTAQGVSVKLIDFGIAGLLGPRDAGLALTSTSTCLGTPEYMSPEQFLGDAPDARADVYSLGVLLHRMVTGQEPFRGSGPDVIMMHLDAPPPFASDLAPGAAAWDEVIARCLAKLPSRRWQTVAEVATALQVALAAPAPDLAAGSLTIQLEVTADSWRATDRALQLAEEYAADQGWQILASADNGLVLTAPGGRAPAVLAACRRLADAIEDRIAVASRILVRAGDTVDEIVTGGSHAD